MRNIEKEIEDFVISISDLWKEEALDGDETQSIADKVLRELDFQNGNLGGDTTRDNSMKHTIKWYQERGYIIDDAFMEEYKDEIIQNNDPDDDDRFAIIENKKV